MRTTDVCPGTLAPGFNTYSPSCLRKVFGGKKVCHIMDLTINDETGGEIITFGTRIGVLPKKLTSIIKLFATEQPKVYELIESSFLEEMDNPMWKRCNSSDMNLFTMFILNSENEWATHSRMVKL